MYYCYMDLLRTNLFCIQVLTHAVNLDANFVQESIIENTYFATLLIACTMCSWKTGMLIVNKSAREAYKRVSRPLQPHSSVPACIALRRNLMSKMAAALMMNFPQKFS